MEHYFSLDDSPSWRNKFLFLRFLCPFITIFLSGWLGLIQISSATFISPDYALCVLYFWAIYRPDLIPLRLLLITGIMIDMLKGGMIGLTPLLWLIAYSCVLSQRRFLVRANFLTLWVVLGGLFLLIHSLEWGLILFLKKSWISPLPLGVDFLLTLGIYPFISFSLSRMRSIFSLSLSDEVL